MNTTKNIVPDKYDIYTLSRNGTPIDRNMSKTLFSMAQYMIEEDLNSLSFEVESRPTVVLITSDLKTGSHGTVCGTIFRAHVDYGDGEQPTEILFLAAYVLDWRDRCLDTWEVISEPPPSPALLFSWKDDPCFYDITDDFWKN